MATWADLEGADPTLARTARRLLVKDASRPPILATIRDGSAPPT